MFKLGDKVRVDLHRDMRFSYMPDMQPLDSTVCTISDTTNGRTGAYRLEEDTMGYNYGDDVLTLLLPNNKGGKLL